jgi:hypothetical protein
MNIDNKIAGIRLIDPTTLVVGERYGFVWGDDNVEENPFVIGNYYNDTVDGNNVVNKRFNNCINTATGLAPNGISHQCYKNAAGPFYDVSSVNQTGGTKRLKKKKGLRKRRTKTRRRRT